MYRQKVIGYRERKWSARMDNGMLPAPPHNETGHTYHHNDTDLFLLTEYGIEKIIGKQYLNNFDH